MTARRIQSARVRGRDSRRALMMAKRIAEAITNLMPANVNGGRSSRPSFMKSQVEPQMRHKSSQTRRDFIFYGWLTLLIERRARRSEVFRRNARVLKSNYFNQAFRQAAASGFSNLMSANIAPWGSFTIEKRPMFGMSAGGFITLPPSSVAF